MLEQINHAGSFTLPGTEMTLNRVVSNNSSRITFTNWVHSWGSAFKASNDLFGALLLQHRELGTIATYSDYCIARRSSSMS